MVRLRILGSPGLTGQDGNELHSVLRQPKRLALLSYLLLEAFGGYVRRDRVIGLFWPESTEQRARSSLSEALSRLRGALGAHVIVTRGDDEIGIAEEGISCDAIEMRRAAEGLDWPEVAELHRGPLLDGLVLDGLPELEQWLTLERGRFARTALDALGRMADEAIARGDGSALSWAERALQSDPLDGRAARRMVRLLATSGRRAAALQVYDGYADRLRTERGIEPSSEMEDLAEAVREGEIAEAHGPTPRVPARDPVPSEPPGEVTEPSATTARPPGGVSWTSVALGAVAALLLVALLSTFRSPPAGPESTLRRYGLALPEGEGLDEFRRPRLALSPDGSTLVYVGPNADGIGQLWLRPRDELRATPLPGTEGATNPILSPDGARIGYLRRQLPGQEQAVMTLPVGGGLPSPLYEGEVGLAGVAWGDDGFVYFDGLTAGGTTGIVRVPETGGDPEQVSTVDRGNGETDHVWPATLPGSGGVLFTVLRNGDLDAAHVVALDLGTGERRSLVQGVAARYSDTGHLLFVRPDGMLSAIAFDPEALQISGASFDLTAGVGVRLSGSVDLAHAADGSLVYVAAPATPEPTELVWTGPDGEIEPVSSDWFDDFGTLALSPDGQRLAVSLRPGAYWGVQDIFVKELPSGPLTRLSLVEPALNHRPEWSADGTWVTFVSNRAGQLDLYRRRADGGPEAEVEILVDGEGDVSDAFHTRDGEWLVYVEAGDIYALELGGRGDRIALSRSPSVEQDPAVSPDGRWLAYASDESGAPEVYVAPFPATGGWRVTISVDGGFAPTWTHDSEGLYYRTPGGTLVLAEVATGPGGRPEVVDRRPVYTERNLDRWRRPDTYDVSPEDGRLLIIRDRDAESNGELVVVEGLRAWIQQAERSR